MYNPPEIWQPIWVHGGPVKGRKGEKKAGIRGDAFGRKAYYADSRRGAANANTTALNAERLSDSVLHRSGVTAVKRAIEIRSSCLLAFTHYYYASNYKSLVNLTIFF